MDFLLYTLGSMKGKTKTNNYDAPVSPQTRRHDRAATLRRPGRCNDPATCGKVEKKGEIIMATKIIRSRKAGGGATWEEESGLLDFLSRVYAEVTRFDSTFDLGVEMLAGQPESIDGGTDLMKHLGFVILRRNSVLTGRDYCLYSVLRGKALYGYIGVYSEGSIETVRELRHITDFGKARLLDWLRDLVKASCEKI
jgi:hypothetical protein